MNTKLEGSANPCIQYLKSYLYFWIPNNADTMYYRFGIKGDESALVLYRRDGLFKWTRLGDYGFQARKDCWYNLGIRVQGSNIRCYLNGEEVINKGDTKFSYGGIGIGVGEQEDMVTDYDDVFVQRLS